MIHWGDLALAAYGYVIGFCCGAALTAGIACGVFGAGRPDTH